MTNTISRDGDMIRRGDAIAALRQARWDISREEFVQAVRALPAVRAGVKPLVWETDSNGAQDATASPFHQFRIIFDSRANRGAWMLFCNGKWTFHETETAAKAEANRIKAETILKELEPQPALDWPTQLDDILSNFAGRQRRLGAEFEGALAANREELYGDGPLPPAPGAAAIRKTAWNIAVEMEVDFAIGTTTEAKARQIEVAIRALINAGKERNE
jgi:hypothetical protein